MYVPMSIQLFELGGEDGGGNETDGTLVASQSETGYTCDRQQTYRLTTHTTVQFTPYNGVFFTFEKFFCLSIP